MTSAIWGDIFGSFFGGGFSSQRSNANMPMRGRDVTTNVVLSFEEAAKGCTKTVEISHIENCTECGGTGARKGTSPSICPDCGGRGQVKAQQRTPFGVISTTRVCSRCGGKGKIIASACPVCNGTGRIQRTRKYDVDIPMGIDDKQIVNIKGKGRRRHKRRTHRRSQNQHNGQGRIRFLSVTVRICSVRYLSRLHRPCWARSLKYLRSTARRAIPSARELSLATYLSSRARAFQISTGAAKATFL